MQFIIHSYCATCAVEVLLFILKLKCWSSSYFKLYEVDCLIFMALGVMCNILFYFVFSGKGGPEQKEYEMTMEFYKEVNPEVRGVEI